jgi:serine/threonine-protein kinase
MRKALTVLIIVGCGITAADARGGHHHGRHAYRYWQALPDDETPRAEKPSTRRTGRDRLAVVAPPDHLSAQKSIDASQIVPRDWKLEPPDPSRNGQRFVSPDGTAWFEWFRVAATDKSIAAHMKGVAFGDGEEITQVRGERNWIAVSGFRGDRIFYREALLACAGDRWHHIAFEYPSYVKGNMTDFVRRAAEAVETTQNSGCDLPVSSAE